MLFVKDNLITFPLNQFSFPDDIEAFCIELNLRKSKWLICCCYNPHRKLIKNHIIEIERAINFYSKTYENIIVLGDFNAEISQPDLASFCAIYNLKSLINEPTCYKNPDNPSTIDLILTNCSNHFQESSVFETGLSDFHKMIDCF